MSIEAGRLRVESEFEMVWKYKAGKPCILFLHGLAGAKEWFEPAFREPLGQKWGILTVDIPGFGESRVLDGDYSMEAQARRIGALLEHLELREVYLVAHSYAGPIANLLYQQQSERIKGMVLAESAFLPGANAWTVRITEHSEEEYRQVFARRCAKAEEFYRPVLVDRSEEKLGMVARALRQTSAEAMYLSSVEMLEYCQSVDLVAEMSSLPVPVVYVQSESREGKLRDDPVLWRVQELGMQIEVLAGCGHCMMVDNPEGFYRLVGEWTNRFKSNFS